MLKSVTKLIITLTAVFLLFRCIDPYELKLNGYESFMVVEGLITDENASYYIRLSHTFQDNNEIPEMVSDAVVFISDDAGNRHYLYKMGDGVYKTDST